MTTDLPLQSIAAIATVVAALITGAISFVNLVLTKEQKTSEFRQAWVDGLRNDLASFFAAARVFARAVEKAILDNDSKALAQRESDLRHQAADTHCKIKLRLNPDEEEHKELLRLIDRAITEQNTMLTQKTDITETIRAIDIATEYARPILKKEWVRVKEGESSFQVARNLAFIVVVVSIILIVFVLRS
jgi:hypothetical protein